MDWADLTGDDRSKLAIDGRSPDEMSFLGVQAWKLEGSNCDGFFPKELNAP